MKKNIKFLAIAMLSATMLASVAGATSLSVKAAETGDTTTSQETVITFQSVDITSYKMELGAGVRVKGDGLRFSAEMDTTTYDNLQAKQAKYGMLIVPKDYLAGGYDLTEENVFGANRKFYYTENPTDEDTTASRRPLINLSTNTLKNQDGDANVELYGAITDVGAEQMWNIYREFVGVAYVAVPTKFDATTNEPTEYEYKFAQYYGGDIANNTRSMYYVSQLTLESDWDGDKSAVETNYITKFNTYATENGYTFGYTEKHTLTTAEGTEITIKDDTKYGNLNEDIAPEFFQNYGDGTNQYYYVLENAEMPTSKLYANGKTNFEVRYTEVEIDENNLAWTDNFTADNYDDMIRTFYDWSSSNGSYKAFSVTAEIPEDGVAGSYLYFQQNENRQDIKVKFAPKYEKNYYQALVNSGKKYNVKFDVYMLNQNSESTRTEILPNVWRLNDSGAMDFGNAAEKVALGEWFTVSYDLQTLVDKWDTRIYLFGSVLSRTDYLNFYLGNVRLEEAPMLWANVTSASDLTTRTKNGGASNITVVKGSLANTDSVDIGLNADDYYIQYRQGNTHSWVDLSFKTVYDKSYYQALLNSGKRYKVTFDIYGWAQAQNSAAHQLRMWSNSTYGTKSTITISQKQWYTIELDLETLVNNCWETWQFGIYNNKTYNGNNFYARFILGHIQLVEGEASATPIAKDASAS